MGERLPDEVPDLGEHFVGVPGGDPSCLLADQAIGAVEGDEGGGLTLGHLVDRDGDRDLAGLEVDDGDFHPFGAEIYA